MYIVQQTRTAGTGATNQTGADDEQKLVHWLQFMSSTVSVAEFETVVQGEAVSQ